MAYALVLNSGEKIRLFSYHQELTYGGLLEGLPTRQMNQRKLEHLKQKGQGEIPLLVFEPEQEQIEVSSPYPFGEPASLPSVTCCADFVGAAMAPRAFDFSELKIIWFQHDFGLPEEHILDPLKQMDWHSHAKDFLW